MFCKNCGKRLADDASVCDECGTVTGRDDSENREADTSQSGLPGEDFWNIQDRYGKDTSADSASYSYSDARSSEKSAYTYGGNSESFSAGESSYTYAPVEEERDNGKSGFAIASLVISIVSLCICCVPCLTQILTIVGLILGILGVNSRQKTVAIIGIVINSIVLLLSLLSLIFWIPILMSEIYYY